MYICICMCVCCTACVCTSLYFCKSNQCWWYHTQQISSMQLFHTLYLMSLMTSHMHTNANNFNHHFETLNMFSFKRRMYDVCVICVCACRHTSMLKHTLGSWLGYFIPWKYPGQVCYSVISAWKIVKRGFFTMDICICNT